MKKIFFFATAAAAVLASCTSEDFTGDDALRQANGQAPISFGFDVPMATRAEGADAAAKLHNQFIVYGEKNESSKAVPSDGNLVIKNYVVNYVTNSAYTTTSNTKNWDYVGFKLNDNSAAISTENYSTNVTPNSGTVEQTIKYWDYAADSYTFTAVSALPADITDGKVKITKTTEGTTNQYDKGYSVVVTDEADIASLFFADRVNIEQGSGTDRTATNAYGGNVTFTFRNSLSQVRVGMYETIPGYDVKVTKFYYVDNAAPTFATMISTSTSNFVANVPNVSPAADKTSVAGTFTVKYYPKTTENDEAGISNHPTITFTPTTASDSKNFITLGDQITAATQLGVTAAGATFDKLAGAFTTVFPQVANDKNLKLKIDYQLSNTVTGEIINITGKTAEVPAQYLQWKSNYKYTYLFKISDDDLYPITFDALVVEAADGQAEYITTVSEPSITTFGVKGTAYSVGKSEYEAGTDIYATIMDGSSVVDFTLGTDVNVYKATITDGDTYPITEASVAESIAETAVGTKKITVEKINDDATTNFTAAPAKVSTVPGEDGNEKTVKALKLTGAKATTTKTAYVIEYVKSADVKVYKVIRVAAAS